MSQDNYIESSGSANKRKHVTVTIQEKIDIISLCDEGKISKAAIASQFGIGKSTVHDIYKNAEKIRMFASDNNHKISKRRRIDQKPLHGESVENEEETEETIIDSIEDFDYNDIGKEEYEIVYETSLPNDAEEIHEKSKYTPVKLTRNSKTLTFREKYDIIQQVEAGTPVSVVRNAYGIGRTTIYDFLRRKEEIAEFVVKSNDGHQRRTFKKSNFPEVETRLIDWCQSQELYTKQQFYERAKLTFEIAREGGLINSPSGFCGSWAWAKRFFHRNPELLAKLRTPHGDPLDPSELSLSNVEYLDESFHDENTSIQSITEHLFPREIAKKERRVLTILEKHQVLNEIDAGRQVPEIAEKFEVPKSMIHDVFKQRNEIRRANVKTVSGTLKGKPQFSKLDRELTRWCLEQRDNKLSASAITDKAENLFDILGLKLDAGWVDNFIENHPEIKESMESDHDEANENEELKIESYEDSSVILYEEEEEMSGTFEFLEPDTLTSDYQEECLIEDVDPHQEDDFVLMNSPKSEFISEKTALNSLQILMKFSEQQGHDDILSHLIDYHNKLNDL